MGAEITSPWFYFQLAIIALAAGIAAGVSLLVRRKLDVVSLTMDWPAPVRLIVRVFIESLGFIAFIIVVALIQSAMLSLTWPSRSFLLGVVVNLATAWVAI